MRIKPKKYFVLVFGWVEAYFIVNRGCETNREQTGHNIDEFVKGDEIILTNFADWLINQMINYTINQLISQMIKQLTNDYKRSEMEPMHVFHISIITLPRYTK